MEETERMQQIMKDFKKVIVDMTRDILTTFPEMTILNTDLKNVCENTDDADETSLKVVFEHCKKVYPDKFFNILYQNESIFEDAADSEFLPGIAFNHLWQDALLSDSSRQVIWKYLQLLLFTIISTIKDKESFGDSAKLFESMNEDDLKTKLEETMAQMQDIFNTHKKENGSTEGESEDINLEDMPNPQDIHDHVSGMLDGKLGKLAKEIAEETALDMNMDMNSSDSVNDVFKNLMKNPTKLMGIVKNVGNKLDAKMKSGDIKESELLKEASDIMEKMKNIPGMGNIQSMMEKMGMPMGGAAGGGKGKVNVNAFQDFMKKNMKAEKQKESMKAKLAARQQAQQSQAQAQVQQSQQAQQSQQSQQSQQGQAPQKVGTLKKVNDSLVFSTGEEVERSSAHTSETPNKKKKKKKAKKTGVQTTKDTTEEE
jgi:hypothetical protein